jgi:hypothetical protein
MLAIVGLAPFIKCDHETSHPDQYGDNGRPELRGSQEPPRPEPSHDPGAALKRTNPMKRHWTVFNSMSLLSGVKFAHRG